MNKKPNSDFIKPVQKRKIPPKPTLKPVDSKPTEASAAAVPRITNETIATHREDVLKSARKYIYPLQHSKNRIVIITTSIIIVAIVAFFSYCTLALYKFQDYSTFLYRVTQVIPFPIARVEGHFVSYNNYLFELDHYVHYYETQQKLNFNSTSGQQQLANYKQTALNKVIDDAYISYLASKNKITVTNTEVNNQITIARQENRLGDNQAELASVLKSYYGWSINDYKRELKTKVLAENLVSQLDTATHTRANNALADLNKGADFGGLASLVSDDTATKANGGSYGFPITQNNINVPPNVVSELFLLKPGTYSGIINTGYSLEIDKNISEQNNQIQAAHIVFNFQDINNYLNPLKEKNKARVYITLKN